MQSGVEFGVFLLDGACAFCARSAPAVALAGPLSRPARICECCVGEQAERVANFVSLRRPDEEQDEHLASWLSSPRFRAHVANVAKCVARIRESGEMDTCAGVAEARCTLCDALALESVFLAPVDGLRGSPVICDRCTLVAAHALIVERARADVAARRSELRPGEHLAIVCRPGELPTVEALTLSPHEVRALVGGDATTTPLGPSEALQLRSAAALLMDAAGEAEGSGNRYIRGSERARVERSLLFGTFVVSARDPHGADRSLTAEEAASWLVEIATWPMAGLSRRDARAWRRREEREAIKRAEAQRQFEAVFAEADRRAAARGPDDSGGS